MLGICAALLAASATAAEVNLYTIREPGLIKPMLDAFTEKTGIKTNTIFLKDGLAERVAAEGANSPADVLMTVDVGNLVDLADKGLAQPVKSSALDAAVPANLRDSEGRWYALSLRGRLVYVAKAHQLTAIAYEDLADPKWKGKICIRSGQHPYNTALTAAMIAKHGEAKAEDWLRAVKANLARKPTGGDREVARDILGGVCDIGVGNSYYVGLMRSGAGGPDQKKWGDAVDIVLPKFTGGGTHVNISGAALAKNAPNRDSALKLLEFLASDEGQKLYAEANFEYPVKKGVKTSPIIDELGQLSVDAMSLADVAKYRKQASALADKVGFDN
jgi:iron(III) transport system substrate-binding protein